MRNASLDSFIAAITGFAVVQVLVLVVVVMPILIAVFGDHAAIQKNLVSYRVFRVSQFVAAFALGLAAARSSLRYWRSAAAERPLESGQDSRTPFLSPLAIAVWGLFTLGLTSVVHLNVLHRYLPKSSPDDPNATRALLLSVIPFVGLFWLPYSFARLASRLNQIGDSPPNQSRALQIAGLTPLITSVFILTLSILMGDGRARSSSMEFIVFPLLVVAFLAPGVTLGAASFIVQSHLNVRLPSSSAFANYLTWYSLAVLMPFVCLLNLPIGRGLW